MHLVGVAPPLPEERVGKVREEWSCVPLTVGVAFLSFCSV